MGGDDVEVVLDERKGRRAAAALDLSLVGTAGLVLRSKAEGSLAGSELVRDVLDSLEREGCTWEQDCGPRFWRPLMSSTSPPRRASSLRPTRRHERLVPLRLELSVVFPELWITILSWCRTCGALCEGKMMR